MGTAVARRCATAALCGLALTAGPGRALAQTPAWASAFVVWPARGGDPRPWRVDPRLMTRFSQPGFPDDLQVFFPNADSSRGALHEIMWVKVIAYDAPSDRFLGILINAPESLRGVRQGDNVSFGWNTARQWPEASLSPGGTLASGWPASSGVPGPDSTLREGIRAYRSGANGHNMPGIEQCVATLTPLAADPRADDATDRGFLIHFVLGRCLAEQYVTAEAVRQFQAAIVARPDSLDPHMALLAELSVLVHTPAEQLPAGSASTWEHAFLDQLDLVRRSFAADTGAMRTLDLVMSPKSATDTTALTPAELANRHRIGFVVFRWKQR